MATVTNSEMYLLNQLYGYKDNNGVLYFQAQQYRGQNIKQIVESIKTQVINDTNNGNAPGQSGLGNPNTDQILQSIQAIESSETLCSMTLAASHIDTETMPVNADGTCDATGGYEIGAHMSLFTTAGNGEAVVVVEGSATPGDWYDDAYAGGPTSMPDGVSSPLQADCMKWYSSPEVQNVLNSCEKVSITGHSKGGNEAKYITLLAGEDGTRPIDNCVSFDGEGFSEEFVNKYSAQIARNQNKITNINAANDYVNLELNDVGNTHYVLDQYIGGPQLYHSLYAMWNSYEMDFDFSKCETQQNPLLAYADRMLNSVLRTMTPEERAQAMDLIGRALTLGIAKSDEKALSELMNQPGSQEIAAKRLGSMIAYAMQNGDEGVRLLKQFIASTWPQWSYLANKLIDLLSDPLTVTVFQLLASILSKYLPDGFLNTLFDTYMSKAGKMPDGKDRKVASSSVTGNLFKANPDELQQLAGRLDAVAAQVDAVCAQLRTVYQLCIGSAAMESFGMFSLNIFTRLTSIGKVLASGRTSVLVAGERSALSSWSHTAEQYARKIREAAQLIEQAESQIAAVTGAIDTSRADAAFNG